MYILYTTVYSTAGWANCFFSKFNKWQWNQVSPKADFQPKKLDLSQNVFAVKEFVITGLFFAFKQQHRIIGVLRKPRPAIFDRLA